MIASASLWIVWTPSTSSEPIGFQEQLPSVVKSLPWRFHPRNICEILCKQAAEECISPKKVPDYMRRCVPRILGQFTTTQVDGWCRFRIHGKKWNSSQSTGSRATYALIFESETWHQAVQGHFGSGESPWMTAVQENWNGFELPGLLI